MTKRLPWCGLALVCAAACGSDPSPDEACNQIVDAFANAWARCGMMSFDAAKQQFSKQFASCSPSSVDQAKVDQCSTDLGAADCNVVKNGGLPSSCTGALK